MDNELQEQAMSELSEAGFQVPEHVKQYLRHYEQNIGAPSSVNSILGDRGR